MTVLAACQSAILRLAANQDGSKTLSVFGSSNRLEAEIADLATDVAIDIVRSHDWRGLTGIAVLTGAGAASFPLPADYDRMVASQSVTNPGNWLWGYRRVETLDEWAALLADHLANVSPGSWIILGGQLQFSPAPPTGQKATFAYIKSTIGQNASGEPIAAFSSDTDSFALDQRLLTLGLIWRWKQMKGLEYAEDMTTYEIALSQAQSRDSGARVIRKGPRHFPGDVRAAWPWMLGGAS